MSPLAVNGVQAALDALDAEIQVIWGTGSVGVTAEMPPVVVARAGGASRVHILPDPSRRVRRAIARVASQSSGVPSMLCDLHAPLVVEAGLHWHVALSYDCSRPTGVALPAGARIVGTTDHTARLLRVEPEWGGQSDWERLVRSDLPWSAATDGARVLAICETSRWSTKGVEAGVWTLPAARGQGLAAAVVSDWSASWAERAPRVFYSTLAINASSRRVAERLRLPRLGQLWYLTEDAQPSGAPSAAG